MAYFEFRGAWLALAAVLALVIGAWLAVSRWQRMQLRVEDRAAPGTELSHEERRAAMVEQQLAQRDIVDQDVLAAMRKVPRHEFVPAALAHQAYQDRPLPIGHSQTISQPYIVALMTQLAQPQPGCRALDIGTGSGYQAAVLAELCEEVYSIEIIEPLAQQAEQRLQRLGYENVHVKAGDGYQGWPEKAPFDVIIVAAAPDHVPPALTEQLAVGGRLVLPVSSGFLRQDLLVIEKQSDGTLEQKVVAPVAFVPMTGKGRQ